LARSDKTIRFTSSRLEGLPAPPRRSNGASTYDCYYDEVQRGLGLRVSSEGRKSFFLLTRDNRGGTVRTRIGILGRIDLEFARDEARRLEGEVVANQFSPSTVRKSLRSEMTFGELRKLRDAALRKENQLSTAYAESCYWDKYFAQWENLKLSDITQGKVKKWHQDLLECETEQRTRTWFRHGNPPTKVGV